MSNVEPSEHLAGYELIPTADEIIEVTAKKFGKKFTRREFLKLMTVLATAGLTGIGKRILDVEYGHWLDYSTPKDQLIHRAMQYSKRFEFGCYPDFENDDNPWRNPTLIKDATGVEDKVGLFFNIEWTDEQSYPGKLDGLVELANHIYYQRGAVPLISIHTGINPNNLHPFHPDNTAWTAHHVDLLYRSLDANCPFPTEKRTYYEFNIPKQFAFLYGPSDEFNGAAHREGFKRTAELYAQRGESSPYPRHLAFCQSNWDDASDYFIKPANGKYVFDRAGVDGYDIFPGKLADWVNVDISFSGWLQLLLCYLVGKRSPADVFGPSIKSLLHVTEGTIPLYLYEMGSKDGDAEWLDYALWFIAAYGGDGAFPFIYNKDYQVTAYNKFYEADWSKNMHDVSQMYGNSVRMLNSRVES